MCVIRNVEIQITRSLSFLVFFFFSRKGKYFLFEEKNRKWLLFFPPPLHAFKFLIFRFDIEIWWSYFLIFFFLSLFVLILRIERDINLITNIPILKFFFSFWSLPLSLYSYLRSKILSSIKHYSFLRGFALAVHGDERIHDFC